VGYKIHSKVCLVVRREESQLRRYVHLATGNYNPQTARQYTDLSYFTCRPAFGEDATNLFNLLTGICQFQPMRKLAVAPFDLHPRLLSLIRREAEHARAGLPARIVARMNSLVDETVIEALYEASEAGVKIDLLVRGICCLRPGVEGLSANIWVRSIVDRFLEHSRIWWFENACHREAYVSSADWMPRNFFRRIEVAFPIEDGRIADRLISEILSTSFADNQKAHELRADGSYRRVKAGKDDGAHRSQKEFMQLAIADKGGEATRLPTKRTAVQLAPPPVEVSGGSEHSNGDTDGRRHDPGVKAERRS
jgi:polyphosphate kinase